jgi:hypothetical protein
MGVDDHAPGRHLGRDLKQVVERVVVDDGHRHRRPSAAVAASYARRPWHARQQFEVWAQGDDYDAKTTRMRAAVRDLERGG